VVSSVFEHKRRLFADSLSIVMAGLVPAIHVFLAATLQRRGCHRKSGLPDFRIKRGERGHDV
jgi:hypothetical protein